MLFFFKNIYRLLHFLYEIFKLNSIPCSKSITYTLCIHYYLNINYCNTHFSRVIHHSVWLEMLSFTHLNNRFYYQSFQLHMTFYLLIYLHNKIWFSFSNDSDIFWISWNFIWRNEGNFELKICFFYLT
jgi:hypothetical protein